MAGTVKTDLLAVRDALAAADRQNPGGLAVGVDAFALVDTAIKNADDMARLANDLNVRLPAGAAKTALATVITDLG